MVKSGILYLGIWCLALLSSVITAENVDSDIDFGQGLSISPLPLSMIPSHMFKAFVILSQPELYHERIAEERRQDIIQQIHKLRLAKPKIYLTHKDFRGVAGTWTFFPVIERVVNRHSNTTTWVFICEEITHVDVKKLLDLLTSFDATKDLFLGHSLSDSQPTIIHHFAPSSNLSGVSYPDLSAGFLMTFSLLKRVASRWSENKEPNFSIDAKYELAKFIWNDGEGPRLLHVPQLCLLDLKEDCVSWIEDSFPDCGPPVPNKGILFAVKTCSKFHKDRVQIVKNTWAKDASNLHFFSDIKDSTIPTVNLGVPNVPSGHCSKTLAIIKYVVKNHESVDWLVITDDDTLISVSRLQKLLSCYNPSKVLALGERYGYGVAAEKGYDYITGGGGMVFTLPTAKQIASTCICPSDDSPDDMILGMCLTRLGIPITHSIYFHQARPNDYSPKFLNHQKPISFHKHWMINPYNVYEVWLEDAESSITSKFHVEL